MNHDILMNIWTEEFAAKFEAETGVEPTEEQIEAAWQVLNFDQWGSEWLANNGYQQIGVE